jgi:Sec-independent protein secretion pathway component TatC
MFFLFNGYAILRELKFRMFYCFLCFIFNFFCFFIFSEEAVFLLTSCFLNDFGYFVNVNILENLYISFYISIFFSFFNILFFILIHFWFFIVRGLYSYENKIFLFLLVLFIFIYLFLLFNIFFISFVWDYVKYYNIILDWKSFPIFLELGLINLISLIFNFMVLVLLIFIFPLFLILLFCYNLINLNFFLSCRKFFYILIYSFVCIFSIPDIFSQVFSFSFIVCIFESLLFLFLLIKYKKL